MRIACRLFAVAAVCGATTAVEAGRFQQFTEKFKTPPDAAKVVAATPLGGPGTEWLCGGGFQPDGTVVAVGTALGPALSVAGREAQVIGLDNPAPPPPVPLEEKDARGQPKLDKSGKPKIAPFAWDHPQATAFVVRLSADLQTVKSVSRLPWRAGGASGAAVDKAGNIYITGQADEKLVAKLAADSKSLAAPPSDGKQAPRTVYLAKLAPDAAKVEWVRYATGPSAAPEVKLAAEGGLLWRGVDFRTLDARGNVLASVAVPGGPTARHALNPRDGTVAYGGEHHWPTGREPWRCPILNIHRPDGSLLYQFYDWGGPFVGLNNLRLVSDTAVRQVAFDPKGNLVVGAWSDGGNSPMYREPMDIRTPANLKGLGMSAWGAGVLSCAYVVRIDPQSYKVLNGTPWLAYLDAKDKPNSIWIRSLDFAADGSVLLGGNSAWGLIQTGNHLNPGGTPDGPYVAVLAEAMDSLRFSSALKTCGKTDLGNGAMFGFASANVGGRPMVLVFSGTAKEEGDAAMPAVKPVQKSFGGGLGDGHVLLLDLGKP